MSTTTTTTTTTTHSIIIIIIPTIPKKIKPFYLISISYKHYYIGIMRHMDGPCIIDVHKQLCIMSQRLFNMLLSHHHHHHHHQPITLRCFMIGISIIINESNNNNNCIDLSYDCIHNNNNMNQIKRIPPQRWPYSKFLNHYGWNSPYHSQTQPIPHPHPSYRM